MYKGIDVSDNQGTINWKQVKAAGIDVAILRSVRGNGKADNQFETNFKGCTENNIAIGVYKYSYATTAADAVIEAKQVVELLNNRKLQCKVWIDVEDKRQRILTKAALTAIIKAFRDIIVNAGYEFGIYCNQDWYNNVLDITQLNSFNRNWWIARYGANNGSPDYSYKPQMANAGWQYTSNGRVNGISGYVDRNEYYALLDKTGDTPRTTKYSIGQKVRVSSYYASATETDLKKAVIKNAVGTITRIIPDAHNPYLLNNGKIGWCNDGDIRGLYDEVQYYQRYTGTSNSLVDAIQALKIDSSFNTRSKIAAQNDIQNYKESSDNG